MTFSSSQQEVYRQLQNPLSWSAKKILITGCAGTGKTYLASQLIECWSELGHPVTVSAPTHQAKHVVGSKIYTPVNRLLTVASLLSRHKVGKFASAGFTAPKLPKSSASEIILVDEASMLGESEVQALLLSDSFVVFLGDPAQLPPVKQRKSTVWEIETRFELIEQMRNEGSIEWLANMSRDRMYFPQYSCSDETVQVVDSTDELFKQFVSCLRDFPESTVWLSYTNEAAISVANRVRSLLGFTSAVFDVGERIRLHTSCAYGYNGEVVTIEGVQPSSMGKRFHRLQIRGSRGAGFVEVLDPLQSDWLADRKRDLLKAYQDGDSSVLDELTYLYESVVEVRYPYSSTIHKSQGTTIDYVFVDANELRGRALTYVAFSRAAKRLTLTRRAQLKVKPDNKQQYKQLTSQHTRHSLWHLKMVLRTSTNSWDGRQAVIDYLLLNPHMQTPELAITAYHRVYGDRRPKNIAETLDG